MLPFFAMTQILSFVLPPCLQIELSELLNVKLISFFFATLTWPNTIGVVKDRVLVLSLCF